MGTKNEELLKLAQLRQSKVYDGYFNLDHFDDGLWECDFVSPFSKSSHNVDSDILSVLQDWSSVEGLEVPFCQESFDLGYDPKIRTNINMIQLLRDHFGKELKDVYTTNLFPYIKSGSMNSSIGIKYMNEAAREFTLPMINIIKPKLVVCFGLVTFNALRKVLGNRKCYRVAEGINASFIYGNTLIYCQSHPGQQGRNKRNRGNVDRVNQDWQQMKSDFDALCS
jgi:restriction system protein